jgi:hypothetical protein
MRIAPGVVAPDAGLSLEGNSMSTTTPPQEKAEESTANRADEASDSFKIGIDTQGRAHYYSRIRGCVTVLDGDTHEHTESLDGRPLSDWMAFIEQELGGWEKNNTFSGSLSDHLCDQLGAAVNGGTDR